MVSRNKNKNTRNARSRTNNSVRHLRRELHGASMRVRADPPATVDRPWNSAVITMPLSTLGNVTVALVNSAFNDQIGSITTTPGILYRFQQVRAWELSGADISLSILDFGNGGDTAAIRTQHDQSGRNHWACVAEMWPITQQNDVVLSTNTTRNLFVLESGATTANVRVHLHLLWRVSGTAQPEVRVASLRVPTNEATLRIPTPEDDCIDTYGTPGKSDVTKNPCVDS